MRIVDTRKTTPGHRLLEKYAVRVGGGSNHRFGLYDAVMIKDNHIKAAGGITAAVQAARKRHSAYDEDRSGDGVARASRRSAVHAGAHIVMLDNMSGMNYDGSRVDSDQSPCTAYHYGSFRRNYAWIRVAQLPRCGVDIISVGGLTHSFQALDISLDLNEKKGGPLRDISR